MAPARPIFSKRSAFFPPDAACPGSAAPYFWLSDLQADPHLHGHKENNLLFPAVSALEAELAAGSHRSPATDSVTGMSSGFRAVRRGRGYE